MHITRIKGALNKEKAWVGVFSGHREISQSPVDTSISIYGAELMFRMSGLRMLLHTAYSDPALFVHSPPVTGTRPNRPPTALLKLHWETESYTALHCGNLYRLSSDPIFLRQVESLLRHSIETIFTRKEGTCYENESKRKLNLPFRILLIFPPLETPWKRSTVHRTNGNDCDERFSCAMWWL